MWKIISKIIYVYLYNWITLLCTWNSVSQPDFSKMHTLKKKSNAWSWNPWIPGTFATLTLQNLEAGEIRIQSSFTVKWGQEVSGLRWKGPGRHCVGRALHGQVQLDAVWNEAWFHNPYMPGTCLTQPSSRVKSQIL